MEKEYRDQTIITNIIVPLPNFIQRYGLVGGKNNLGYGRVKFTIESEDIEENVFKSSHFRKQDKQYLRRKDKLSSERLRNHLDL